MIRSTEKIEPEISALAENDSRRAALMVEYEAAVIAEADAKPIDVEPSVLPGPTFEECFGSLERQIAIKNAAGIGITGERRAAFLLALGAEMVRGRTPVVEVLDELWAVNDGRCAPPLPDDEVERIVDRAAQDELARLRGVAA